MSMNIQDMAAVMAAKNEAFRGTEQVPEKVTIYNQLCAHAAAIAKTLRTPMHADSLELREQNALIYVEFSLPRQHSERQHPEPSIRIVPAG